MKIYGLTRVDSEGGYFGADNLDSNSKGYKESLTCLSKTKEELISKAIDLFQTEWNSFEFESVYDSNGNSRAEALLCLELGRNVSIQGDTRHVEFEFFVSEL